MTSIAKKLKGHIVDVKGELDEKSTILLLIKSLEYNDLIVDVAKQLSGKKVAYVTLNKTYSSLKELFEKNKVDLKEFIFVDAITKTIKDVPKFTDGCYYATSPSALTEISILIAKLFNHGFDYLIFDSLTNLLTYQNKTAVLKFFSNNIAKIKEGKKKGLFYALNTEEHELVIQETGMFVDKVVKIE